MVDKGNKMEYYTPRHGGPYDRGGADSYYRRGPQPHFYVEDTGSSRRIERFEMRDEEIKAYMAGYNENEKSANFKNWE